MLVPSKPSVTVRPTMTKADDHGVLGRALTVLALEVVEADRDQPTEHERHALVHPYLPVDVPPRRHFAGVMQV